MVDAPCYWPDGTLATHHHPCLVHSGAACCAQGDICLANGICASKSRGATTYARGSCTDQFFVDNTCPQFCLDGTKNNLAGINKVEKCSGHVDGGAKYCCDIGKGDKKCKCDADVFTIYASTTPIKTIAIPQPTYARLYNPPPASLSNSTTSASGSLTSISQYNAYRPRSLPTSTVSPDFSGNGHSDNQSQWCHNAPSAYLGGAIVLVFALIMFAVLCVLGARQRRLSKQRGACYNSIAETHYNDLKEGADPLPSETRISDT